MRTLAAKSVAEQLAPTARGSPSADLISDMFPYAPKAKGLPRLGHVETLATNKAH